MSIKRDKLSKYIKDTYKLKDEYAKEVAKGINTLRNKDEYSIEDIQNEINNALRSGREEHVLWKKILKNEIYGTRPKLMEALKNNPRGDLYKDIIESSNMSGYYRGQDPRPNWNEIVDEVVQEDSLKDDVKSAIEHFRSRKASVNPYEDRFASTHFGDSKGFASGIDLEKQDLMDQIISQGKMVQHKELGSPNVKHIQGKDFKEPDDPISNIAWETFMHKKDKVHDEEASEIRREMLKKIEDLKTEQILSSPDSQRMVKDVPFQFLDREQMQSDLESSYVQRPEERFYEPEYNVPEFNQGGIVKKYADGGRIKQLLEQARRAGQDVAENTPPQLPADVQERIEMQKVRDRLMGQGVAERPSGSVGIKKPKAPPMEDFEFQKALRDEMDDVSKKASPMIEKAKLQGSQLLPEDIDFSGEPKSMSGSEVRKAMKPKTLGASRASSPSRMASVSELMDIGVDLKDMKIPNARHSGDIPKGMEKLPPNKDLLFPNEPQKDLFQKSSDLPDYTESFEYKQDLNSPKIEARNKALEELADNQKAVEELRAKMEGIDINAKGDIKYPTGPNADFPTGVNEPKISEQLELDLDPRSGKRPFSEVQKDMMPSSKRYSSVDDQMPSRKRYSSMDDMMPSSKNFPKATGDVKKPMGVIEDKVVDISKHKRPVSVAGDVAEKIPMKRPLGALAKVGKRGLKMLPLVGAGLTAYGLGSSMLDGASASDAILRELESEPLVMAGKAMSDMAPAKGAAMRAAMARNFGHVPSKPLLSPRDRADKAMQLLEQLRADEEKRNKASEEERMRNTPQLTPEEEEAAKKFLDFGSRRKPLVPDSGLYADGGVIKAQDGLNVPMLSTSISGEDDDLNYAQRQELEAAGRGELEQGILDESGPIPPGVVESQQEIKREPSQQSELLKRYEELVKQATTDKKDPEYADRLKKAEWIDAAAGITNALNRYVFNRPDTVKSNVADYIKKGKAGQRQAEKDKLKQKIELFNMYKGLVGQQQAEQYKQDKFAFEKDKFAADQEYKKAQAKIEEQYRQGMLDKSTARLKLDQLKFEHEKNKKAEMTPYQKEMVDLKKKEMENKAEKPKELSFEEKERKKAEIKDEFLFKKQKRLSKEEKDKEVAKLRENIGTIDGKLSDVNSTLALIKRIDDGDGVIGSGPVDQFLAKIFGGKLTPKNQNPALLRQKLNAFALDEMKRIFAGMSKAIDSDAERRFFMQSLPSMSEYESDNIQILTQMKEKLEGLKDRAQKEIQNRNKDEYSAYDKGIDAVMQAHNISREQAIKELKKQGKIK